MPWGTGSWVRCRAVSLVFLVLFSSPGLGELFSARWWPDTQLQEERKRYLTWGDGVGPGLGVLVPACVGH